MSDTMDHAEIGHADTPGDNADQGADDVEAKARLQGWRSAEELEAAGKKPGKVKTAEEFLADGERFAPYVKAGNKQLEKALDNARKELAEAKADIKKLGAFASEAAKNAYSNAKRDIEADIEAAAAAGDVAAVKTATKALVDLGEEVKAPLPATDGPDPEWQEAEAKWLGENAWFNTEEAMTVFAEHQDAKIAKASPGMAPADRLAEVTKRVRAEFPHKFTNPNRERPGAVEAPGAGRRGGTKTRSDLPPEARAFMDRMVKRGDMSEADYLKGYQW